MNILILGGYGTFGGRLVQLLADNPRLTLIVAGRSQAKAADFCAGLSARAELVPRGLDRDGDLAAQIERHRPDLIVDASGPFQSYGTDPYRVVKAALVLGVSYIDLADGSDFVAGIARFDEAARASGIFLLSGVSSFPVLTAAVVRRLAEGMARVASVTAGIAPSPYAGVGLNVIRAIAGYAGRPVKLVRDGRWTTGNALTETMRCTIAPPGRLPLRSIRFSLVDVPDLQVVPALWPGLRSVWIGAGPVPEVLHRALNALAWLVRLGVVPSLAGCASIFHEAINRLRWGEHRGGMVVSVRGETPAGAQIERAWHLLAEGDDGPFIPSMAAAAVVRRCLDGRPPAPGARPAATDLGLDDYAAIFSGRAIYAGLRETGPDTAAMPLYRRVLGAAWHDLPPPLRAMHDLADRMTAEGIATVERGRGLFARLVAEVFRFPRSGRNVPVAVAFERRGSAELWRRTFAGRSFASLQSEGRGRFDKLIVERFGPFAFGLALVLEQGKMRLVLRRWTFLGVPLPLALAPAGDSYEYVRDGRFHFHVALRHPLTGPILRYRGWLEPRD
jgi:hypothetical protein